MLENNNKNLFFYLIFLSQKKSLTNVLQKTNQNYNIYLRRNKFKSFLLINTINNKLWNLEIYKKFQVRLKIFYIIFNFFKKTFLKTQELELKGINYRYTKFMTTMLLDLGRSHFQVLYFFKYNFLFSLKKKKIKKILFLNFNNSTLNSSVNFFWYKLKSVGPYKLKGFQFINEKIKLKEGKKPFK